MSEPHIKITLHMHCDVEGIHPMDGPRCEEDHQKLQDISDLLTAGLEAIDIDGLTVHTVCVDKMEGMETEFVEVPEDIAEVFVGLLEGLVRQRLTDTEFDTESGKPRLI